MFKYFHCYLPKTWEAQIKCGLIDENSGIKFSQSLLIPESDKFNNLAAKNSELFRIERELKLPMYIDRLQGGCYFEGYNYDKSLVNTYRELLGDGFWGFQMHEWMSNMKSDLQKIKNGGCTEWTEEGITAAVKKLFPTPYTFLECQSAKEFEKYGCPESFAEFMALAKNLLDRRLSETSSLLIPCDSFGLAHELEINAGIRRFMPEIGAQTADTRLQMAYARGSARTHKLTFGAYYEPWGGKPFSACCYQRDGKNEWGIGNSSDFPFETQGENGGSSRSMQMRMQLYAYFAGASFFGEEWGMCNTFYDWRDFELSPYGKVKQKFLNLVRKYPDRGDMYTPIAAVLPKELPVLCDVHSDEASCFGYPLYGAEARQFALVRKNLRVLFCSSTPMCGTETTSLINSDIPDCIDIVHDGNDLSGYEYLIDLTDNPDFARKHKNVCRTEDAIPLINTSMPCSISGGIHWFVNKTSDGYLLIMLNNSGVYRSVADGEKMLPEGDTVVSVTVKNDGTLKLLEGETPVKEDGVYHIPIKSGEWALAKLYLA